MPLVINPAAPPKVEPIDKRPEQVISYPLVVNFDNASAMYKFLQTRDAVSLFTDPLAWSILKVPFVRAGPIEIFEVLKSLMSIVPAKEVKLTPDDATVKLLDTFKEKMLLVELIDKVPEAGPSIVKDCAYRLSSRASATLYELAEDAELNITLSLDVGTDAPLDPPEVADQFVVLELLQVPDPPTQ